MSLPLFNAVHDYSNKSLNDDDEVLYRSAQTVIIRHWSTDGRSQVVKWAFGVGATARLERERSVLSRLDGMTGVVRLGKGLQEQESLVLEDSHGVVLNKWLSSADKSLQRKLQVSVGLARILADMHRSGVLHRDINPSNILICEPDDRVVLIDFDLACAGGEDRVKVAHSRNRGVLTQAKRPRGGGCDQRLHVRHTHTNRDTRALVYLTAPAGKVGETNDHVRHEVGDDHR